MAKRPRGIIVGVVILFLQASLMLGLEFLARDLDWFWGGLGLAFLIAGIGLLLLHRWAQLLVLVFSGFGLLIGAFGLLGIGLAALMNPKQVSPIMLLGGAATPLIWLALSLWWIRLLTSARVREAFGHPERSSEAAQSGPPLSIKVIAILMGMGILSIFSIMKIPESMARLFGMQVPLWMFWSYTLISMLIGLCLAVGLWRLRPWARIGTIIYMSVSCIQILSAFSAPPPTAEELGQFLGRPPAELEPMLALQSAMTPWILGFSMAFLVLQVVFLVIRKEHFIEHRSV